MKSDRPYLQHIANSIAAIERYVAGGRDGPPLSLPGQFPLLRARGLTVNRDEDVQGHSPVFQPPGSAFIIRA